MSQFDLILSSLRTEPFATKKQLLEYSLQVIQQLQKRKQGLSQADKAAILDYAWAELDAILLAIPNTASYREKDLIFTCEDLLLGLVMHVCPNAAEIPAARLAKIELLVRMVAEERRIETCIDTMFQQPSIAEADVRNLLSLVSGTEDEYQKGKLYSGLVHYREDLSRFTADARASICGHIAAELKRYLACGQLDEDCVNCLELIADISRSFERADIIDQLYEVMKRGYSNVNFFAVDTLLTLGREIPADVIAALARDLGYADLTYSTLAEHGRQDLFPREYASAEYLAKSDLVHWLMYPTELGQAPDEIEYIGKITYLFRKEAYYVFKYRSGSDTLDDQLKNKWLIGWSSKDGGTFSNFDEYAKYEKPTVDATLKHIKKKLIG